MSKEQTITGVMLTDQEARIAVIETEKGSGMMSLNVLARVPLDAGASINDRLRPLHAELTALGCARHSPVWVACSLPEMSFASVRVEKTDIDTLGPVAWLKFKKEVEKLPEKVIFDFELPEKETDGVVPLWELPAFAAPYDELEQIESWFTLYFKLQGITMDMFACRNLLARADTGDETVALLSCEKELSRIMYVKNGCTVFTRTIKTGTGTLFEYVKRDLEQPVAPETVEQILNLSEAEYTIHVNPHKAAILAACTSGVNRLFTQVARTLDYYSDHLKNPRPEKLYLTGDMELLKRFIPDLSGRLMLTVEMLTPAMAGIELSEEAAASIAADGGERYAAATGAALGPVSAAPNLICTHDVQARLSKTAHLRKLTASACIGAAVILSAVLLVQLRQVHTHGAVLEKMKAEASRERLHISTDHADLKVEEIRRKHEDALLLAERYKLLSALIEIQSLTPPGILIKNLSLDNDSKARNGLMLEGVVMGVNGSGASHLAKYVVDLNSSLMFSQVVIISQSELENDPLLRRKGALPFKIEGKFIAALDENQG